MIRFHTLGSLDLRRADGVELQAVLKQPKRLGLLAYLAVASPRRFHRRDTLLGLFWPELDQEHARAALRRALYFLRAQLGAESIAGRGDDEIGVPEEVLWCDAVALEQAIAQARPEEALGLYRGTFLEGLYVTGASAEYQEWLERERTRLRAAATSAARTLADREAAAGRTAEAAQWGRRALDLSPDDESTLRKTLTLLDHSGDRSAALRLYEEFARRMAQELELEPAAETKKLVDAIRNRGEAQGQRPPPLQAERPADSNGIAVLPFRIRGDERFSYLSEGMVDLLGTKLDGAGDIRTVDPRTLLRFLGQSPIHPPPGGRAVAEHFGVGRYLEGTIVEAGGRLQANGTVYSLQGQVLANATATAAGEGEIFELVDDLARQLLRAQGVTSGTRLTRLAGLTTASLPALRSYLLGERELRGGRYFDALEAFQAALDADPSFALAYYRMAASAAGCALPELARELADRGYQHRERLSPHDQLVFTAQRAWLHGDVDEAESLYNAIIGNYPDDLEAWFHLGDLLFHSNPLRGRSSAEARGPLERVLQLQPTHAGALVHLVRVSAIEQRRSETLKLIERVLSASPEGDQALAMRALRAYTTQDHAEIERILGELQTARAVTVAIAFSDVALYSGNLEGAEGLARSFIQVARSPALQALCHTLVAYVALARGNEAGALEELNRAERLDSAWGLEMRGLFATLPFRSPSALELRDVRDRLLAWDPTSAQPSGFLVFAMHNELHPALRLYLLGLLDLKLGEPETAAARAAELSREVGKDRGIASGLLIELRAAIARAEGRPEEALTLLDQWQPQLWFQLTVASPFFSLVSQRWLRAELLRETGDAGRAAGWYRSIAERSPYELIYSAPARARMAALNR